MEVLTFDQLPKAVSELLEKVSKIEDILNQNSSEKKETHSLFSIKQASTFLNLSISTIYGKVCRREIPVSKQGKRLYFDKSELLEWIRAGRTLFFVLSEQRGEQISFFRFVHQKALNN